MKSKLNIRFLSTVLCTMMLLTSIPLFGTVSASAATKSLEEMDADERIESIYTTTVYKTPEEKLNNGRLEKMLEKNGYALWVDSVSGEIAFQDTASGSITFSNPYDLAASKGSVSTKKQLLSQIMIQYTDNGTTKYLYSFEEAAMREQISVQEIKSGIRVEYTIGREAARKLIPRWISEERYQKYIYGPMEEAFNKGELSEYNLKKIDEYYTKMSLAEKKTERAKALLIATYPICEKMDIRVFAPDAAESEMNKIENLIKLYCPDYTFEMMDEDHAETGYEAEDEKYPVFKLALEYSIDEDGLVVRMPCNGLRYDMATYTLEYISILPYMGAGNNKNGGYNFYPDGSGALFDYSELDTSSTTTVRGKVYGIDYAYHTISGTYQKAIRYPVYGSVAAENILKYSYSVTYTRPNPENSGETITVTEAFSDIEISSTIKTAEQIKTEIKTLDKSLTQITDEAVLKKVTVLEASLVGSIETTSYKRGMFAIIESGESLAEIATYHAGSLSNYSTMMNYFNPKPKDSYDISDSISVTSSSTWTVVSNRKYTGSFVIRYIPLVDKGIADEVRNTVPTYSAYEPTWLGMSEAYRAYLIGNGTIQKLTEEDVEADQIPLYLEVFGAMETQQTIATIPVDVMTPLTTFENVKTMYDELSGDGIKNVNFKMTGFANGGMYSTVPSSLKWEKVLGGAKGFRKLIEQAEEINAQEDGSHLGLYPDFDFAYINVNTAFDSTNLKKDAVKTIDNRYTSKRTYSATLQKYVSFYQLAISPSRYEKFYDKLMKKYAKYDIDTLSLSTLGNALNSDFDEDDPYNREDGKEYTVSALDAIKNYGEGYTLMADGANSYTWAYVDQMINMDLDSSRYIKASCAVPFIGSVLHSYKQFAGTAFNEEGDTDYALLKAIENGASLYFILSYQNTNYLKEDESLREYYSVRYDIWYSDVVEYYNTLNDLMKDVQTKQIVAHEFLNDCAERVLTDEELLASIEQQIADAVAAAEADAEAALTATAVALADARHVALSLNTTAQAILDEMDATNTEMLKQYTKLYNIKSSFTDSIVDGFTGEEADSKKIGTFIDVNIKGGAESIMQNYAKLQSLKYDMDQLKIKVDKAYDTILNGASSLSSEAATLYLQEANDAKTAVTTFVASAATKLAERAALYNGTTNSAENIALKVLAETTVPAGLEEYETALAEIKTAHAFTAEEVREKAVFTPSVDTGDDDEEGENESVALTVAKNMIVAVTYGDYNETTHASTAYKTFLLNYNNYAVRVTYNGTLYTVPSGGYVVIYR